jgi:hypothetical protein
VTDSVVKLDEAIQHAAQYYRLVFLAGAPGSGKTTVLQTLNPSQAETRSFRLKSFFKHRGREQLDKGASKVAITLCCGGTSVGRSHRSNKIDGYQEASAVNGPGDQGA